MPALGGAPEPTTGSAIPATGGATVPRWWALNWYVRGWPF